MTGTVPAIGRRLLPHLPGVANAILVVLIGLAAARLFWLLWPVEAMPVTADLATHRPDSGSPALEVDVDSIASAHLFGEKAAGDGPAADEVIDAPETRLNLTLTGIVSSASGERSWALIRNDKREQSAYAKGDTIAEGVKLHAIHANRVILDRSGRYETLTLEREKEADAVQRLSRQEEVTGGAAEQLGEIRQEVMSDPAKISQYIRLQPERRDGNLVGYRIYPGQERELFRELGLRPGELVTAINGIELDDASRNMEVLRTLSQADGVSVTLERGGEQRTMNVSFE